MVTINHGPSRVHRVRVAAAQCMQQGNPVATTSWCDAGDYTLDKSYSPVSLPDQEGFLELLVKVCQP